MSSPLQNPSARAVFPFAAIVGQDLMKQALILNTVSPAIGGVLIRGEKGTAKSTAVRGLTRLFSNAGGRGLYLWLRLEFKQCVPGLRSKSEERRPARHQPPAHAGRRPSGICDRGSTCWHSRPPRGP